MEPTSAVTKPTFKKWLLPVVTVLVLLAIGVATWMILKSSSEQAAEETPTVAIAITDNGFSPTTVKIKPGQDVTWTNQTDKTQQLAGDESKPEGFKTGEALGKGDTYSFTFEQTGVYHYHNPSNLAYRGIVIVE